MDVLCLGEEFVYERIADEKADFQLPSQGPTSITHLLHSKLNLIALYVTATMILEENMGIAPHADGGIPQRFKGSR